MLSLIPPQYKLMALAALCVACAGAGGYAGWDIKRAYCNAENAERARQDATVLEAAMHRADEKAVEADRSRMQNEVTHVENQAKIEALRDDTRSAIARGLRNAAASCQRAVSNTTAAVSSEHPASSAGSGELPDRIADDLSKLGRRADAVAEQLRSCQADIAIYQQWGKK